VARGLIVGCGCRGRELGARLRERDWQVRGTSRSAEGVAAIEAGGLDAAAADPERPGTVLELCGDVTVVVWLLGSARGDPTAIAAIHGPRLERLLEKLVDSPVRGFVYEASGGVEESQLRSGRAIVERAAETWLIPVVALEEGRGADGWAERTASAVTRVVGG
jgi:uncharacterized protein YbjT (DUF2867 family)